MKISITDEGCSVHTVFFHFKEKGYAFPEHTHAHTRTHAHVCLQKYRKHLCDVNECVKFQCKWLKEV